MFHNVDWTATGTMILATIAFGSFWVQLWFSRKQLRDSRAAFEASLATQREVSNNEIAIRLYLQFVERWDSPRMIAARRYLALHFLGKFADSSIKEDVLNFFEDIGALFLQARVDEHLTYESLSYYATGWWFACKPHVLRLRANKGDATLFTKFEEFANRMLELEAKARGVDQLQIMRGTENTLEQFLQEERDL